MLVVEPGVPGAATRMGERPEEEGAELGSKGAPHGERGGGGGVTVESCEPPREETTLRVEALLLATLPAGWGDLGVFGVLGVLETVGFRGVEKEAFVGKLEELDGTSRPGGETEGSESDQVGNPTLLKSEVGLKMCMVTNGMTAGVAKTSRELTPSSRD